MRVNISCYVLLCLVLSACNSTEESALEHAEKHLDPTYVCPMHPQIVRDEPGSCPICGMDLVKKAVDKTETALEHAEKHLDPTYVCPMHPQIVRDEPGSCPICGMDLVKKQPEKQETVEQHPSVTLSAGTIQNMGVRTQKVQQGSLSRTIQTVGYVTYDENKIAHVHPRSTGWVEKLKVRAEGDVVQADQVLLEMYSPEIFAAQEEFLVSLRVGNSKLLGENVTAINTVARQKLRLLAVPEAVINTLIDSGQAVDRIPLLAPQAGIITQLGIREGMYVTPSLELFTIADLSTIWVQIEIYEHQLNWVKVGQQAEITVPALPGQHWQGQVDYIYPQLTQQTRTLKVRLKFNNPQQLLKPNMFAQAEIQVQPKTNVLKIPQEALIVTGAGERVILALDEGRFQPVAVTSGISSQGMVEIRSGLKVNQRIVTSGQFLIDSESNLQASLQRLAAE